MQNRDTLLDYLFEIPELCQKIGIQDAGKFESQKAFKEYVYSLASSGQMVFEGHKGKLVSIGPDADILNEQGGLKYKTYKVTNKQESRNKNKCNIFFMKPMVPSNVFVEMDNFQSLNMANWLSKPDKVVDHAIYPSAFLKEMRVYTGKAVLLTEGGLYLKSGEFKSFGGDCGDYLGSEHFEAVDGREDGVDKLRKFLDLLERTKSFKLIGDDTSINMGYYLDESGNVHVRQFDALSRMSKGSECSDFHKLETSYWTGFLDFLKKNSDLTQEDCRRKYLRERGRFFTAYEAYHKYYSYNEDEERRVRDGGVFRGRYQYRSVEAEILEIFFIETLKSSGKCNEDCKAVAKFCVAALGVRSMEKVQNRFYTLGRAIAGHLGGVENRKGMEMEMEREEFVKVGIDTFVNRGSNTSRFFRMNADPSKKILKSLFFCSSGLVKNDSGEICRYFQSVRSRNPNCFEVLSEVVKLQESKGRCNLSILCDPALVSREEYKLHKKQLRERWSEGSKAERANEACAGNEELATGVSKLNIQDSEKWGDDVSQESKNVDLNSTSEYCEVRGELWHGERFAESLQKGRFPNEAPAGILGIASANNEPEFRHDSGDFDLSRSEHQNCNEGFGV